MRDESESAVTRKPASRWGRTKDVVGDILLMVFGGWLLFHFVMFWLYGWVFVGESCGPWLAKDGWAFDELNSVRVGMIAVE